MVTPALITPGQIRAGRALLRWTQATLAHRAAVSAVTLNMIENETVKPRNATMATIQAALEAAGLRFLAHDGVQFIPQRRHNETNSDSSRALRSDTARNAIPPPLQRTTV